MLEISLFSLMENGNCLAVPSQLWDICHQMVSIQVYFIGFHIFFLLIGTEHIEKTSFDRPDVIILFENLTKGR